MRRAILFRYHTRPEICRNRIALLRRLNPRVAIYGMYGGPNVQPPSLPLDHNYKLPFEEPRFKWQNGDLCVRQWFIDRGYRFRFDMLHIVEWDLIFLKPLTQIYAGIDNGIGVSKLESLAIKRAGNWPWITSDKGRAQLKELRTFIRKKYGRDFTDETQLACDFPGTCLSRTFLERYAAEEIPALLHDEIRVPTFAQICGMPIHDTGLKGPLKFWNCSKMYIAADTVYAAKFRQSVFHPVKDALNIKRLLN